jgi:hypothetical protein
MATKIALVFTGQSGSPFSYVYNDNGLLNNETFSPGLSAARNLIYIPASANEIVFGRSVTGTNGTTTIERLPENEQQTMWQALNSYIESVDYLRNNRGSYAERFADRTPFTGIFDVKISQDFFLKTATGKRHTLTVGFNMFNAANFINKDWGRRYFVGTGGNPNYRLLTYLGKLPDGTTPVFSFNTPASIEPWNVLESGINSALWQGQLELRYTF